MLLFAEEWWAGGVSAGSKLALTGMGVSPGVSKCTLRLRKTDCDCGLRGSIKDNGAGVSIMGCSGVFAVSIMG
jgi:hypothetical protein